MAQASDTTDKQAPERRLFIVDGSSYIYRAFFGSPPLTTRDGTPTNAVLVFTNMLMALIRDHDPDLLAIAFDPEGATFRHALFGEYKANRKERPQELKSQFPLVKELVSGMNICGLECDEFEADDVIATLVEKAVEAGLAVTIVSGDKDLMQLVDDDRGVCMLDTMGRMDRLFTAAEVEEKYGVGPAQLADVLALAGDSSDNVPGVPGVGPKTAGKLVAEFGTLEMVLGSIDKISGKKRKENLETYADQARLSLELVTLRRDVPLTVDADGDTRELEIADLEIEEPDLDRLLPLLNRLEFHRLTAELSSRGEPVEILPSGDEYADETAKIDYRTVLKESELNVVLGMIQDAREAGLDDDEDPTHGAVSVQLLTHEDDPMTARIVGVALSWGLHVAAYVPIAHRTLVAPKQLKIERVMALLAPLLGDADHPKVVHDDKWHRILLGRHGVALEGVTCDTSLASYLIDPGRRAHSLDALAQEIFEHEPTPLKDILGSGRNKRRLDQVEVEETEEYACERADLALALARQMMPVMAERGLDDLHDNMELPLSRVLAKLERVGVLIDKPLLAEISEELLEQMKTLEARAFEIIGRQINLNSPKQLSEVLFDEMAIEPALRRKTTHGYSTDAAQLELLADDHEIAAVVLEYRTVSKLRSTYTDTLPTLENPDTGRIHTHFNQTVAATGRLSSSNPNLQNIPVRTEQGRRIRRAFVPREGWVMLAADYSQIELRLMAHMSEEPTLVEAFKLGQDVHARTAAEVYEVELDQVDRTQRGHGKTLNFALLYGMGINRLARELDVTRRDARKFLARFEESYVKLRRFFDELTNRAAREGYAETLFGRRRYIPELRSRRRNLQALGQRLAINTPVQGTAADLMKAAMIRVDEQLAASDLEAVMLLQVHDELVFECPPGEVEALAALVRQAMTSVMRLKVKLVVDVKTGDNWADMTELEVAS